MEDICLSIATATYTVTSATHRIGRGAVQRYVETNNLIKRALDLI